MPTDQTKKFTKYFMQVLIKGDTNSIGLIKIYFVLLFLMCPFINNGQFFLKDKKINLELLASEFAHSERFRNFNENDRSYTELRAGYRINAYFETALVAGYMRKDLLYFAQKNGTLSLLFMDRRYVPVGINGRVYLSKFFEEKIKLWKKQGLWDVYNQFGVNILFGRDENDSREQAFRDQGYFAPYYLYPYVVRYNRLYLTYVLGIRYNVSKTFGLFFEAGEGSLNTLHIGLRAQF